MRSFYKKFFILMIPMALKELISSLVNLVDTIMVGQLGENAIAAVGIGNQVYFLYTVFLFGISCGAGVFASQFWGKQNIKEMRSVLGLNILLGFGISLVFVAAAFFMPVPIFEAFRANAEVMEIGIPYLKIVCIGYLATAVTTAFDMSVCCSERAGLPFLVRVIGLCTNVFLNWVLIFGHLGVSAMGVNGAAVATVIARFTELTVMLSVVYGKKMIQAASFREFFAIRKSLVVQFCKTATPVILNEMAWALGTLTYTWVFARLSGNAMVVVTIVQNMERLMLVFFHGGGNAAGVFIGKAVGAQKYKQAYVYAKKLMFLSACTALVLSALCVLLRPVMLMPYHISEEARRQAMDILLIVSVMMNVKSMTFLLIVGVFRNGGDTRTACLIDIGAVWFIGVPSVTIAGLFFHLPLTAVYAVMYLEEAVKLVVSIWRFRSKKWIKNVVEQIA